MQSTEDTLLKKKTSIMNFGCSQSTVPFLHLMRIIFGMSIPEHPLT